MCQLLRARAPSPGLKSLLEKKIFPYYDFSLRVRSFTQNTETLPYFIFLNPHFISTVSSTIIKKRIFFQNPLRILLHRDKIRFLIFKMRFLFLKSTPYFRNAFLVFKIHSIFYYIEKNTEWILKTRNAFFKIKKRVFTT